MKLNHRNITKAGFQPSNPFTSHGNMDIYWRQTKDSIQYINSITEEIGFFRLTKEEMKLFNEGKLSCSAPGCCSPTGYKRIQKRNAYIVCYGEPRSQKHLEKLLNPWK